MNTKTLFKRIVAMLLVAVMLVSVVGCKDKTVDQSTGGGEQVAKTYTYNTYTTISPSNWNELSYQDNNDTQIMNYLGSSFFTYDFKYDENGNILPGEFEVEYSAATKLEDVSAKYVGTKWNVPDGATGYAYKFTLRQDLKWDDGTPITAADFVYTMKEQLNPLFKHYRADSFYNGSTIIVNAQNYVKQGSKTWEPANGVITTYSEDLDSKLVFKIGPTDDTYSASCYVRTYFEFPDSYDVSATANYLITNYLGECAFTVDAAVAMEGKTLAEIKADPTLKAAWEAFLGWWQTEPNEELHFFITEYEFPVVDFEDVGIFVGDNEYELVIVLEKALPLLKDDGSLSYKAAYNMASLPLVHKAKFEASKTEPADGATLWTSNYNTSVATTASWGPYKLESFQSGKEYTLVRNENWYGYALEENQGLYQTDKIVCVNVKDWNAAWLKFLAGEIDDIGIDVTVADEYKGSDRAFFTPDDYVQSLQLQSNVEALKSRESEGINKSILAYADFRKAISLSIDRADFANKTTTSSLAGFGLFNSMHYYDVENGGVFRNTDEAKQVLCDVYAVDVSKYESLDKAAAAITGYNLEEARKLINSAYDAALAAGDIKEGDKVVLTFGTAEINDVVQRRFDYLAKALKEAAVGTKLEGRIDFEIKDFQKAWANDFRAGAYDICMGGWTGAAWDPGYFLLAYLSPDYMYSKAWATDTQTMTFTMKGVGENGTDIKETMTLLEWYDCLNGATGAKYDWSENALEQSKRLQLIAALEEEVLSVYYTVPLYNNFSASLISYKTEYVTYEYNTFMSYGGIKYMTYNFDDAAWEAEVAKYNGQLNYK